MLETTPSADTDQLLFISNRLADLYREEMNNTSYLEALVVELAPDMIPIRSINTLYKNKKREYFTWTESKNRNRDRYTSLGYGT